MRECNRLVTHFVRERTKKNPAGTRHAGLRFCRIIIFYYVLNLLAVRTPRLELLEEIVALVVNEDECREVLNGDLPYCLHAQLRIFHTLDALDRTL